MKNKIIILIILISSSINLLAGWVEFRDGLLDFIQNSSVENDNDISNEIVLSE